MFFRTRCGSSACAVGGRKSALEIDVKCIGDAATFTYSSFGRRTVVLMCEDEYGLKALCTVVCSTESQLPNRLVARV